MVGTILSVQYILTALIHTAPPCDMDVHALSVVILTHWKSEETCAVKNNFFNIAKRGLWLEPRSTVLALYTFLNMLQMQNKAYYK